MSLQKKALKSAVICIVCLFIISLTAEAHVFHSFTSPKGKKVDWIACPDGKGGTIYKTVWIENGQTKSKTGLDPNPIVGDGDNEDPDWSNLPEGMDIAETMLHITTDNSITISTNKPIKTIILNLRTGLFVGEEVLIYDSLLLDITSFATGCNYAALIFQEFEETLYLVRTHNFCKF